MKIQVLRPKISMASVAQKVLKKREKQLISMELIYVPFCFFIIKYKLKKDENERKVVMAVDMVIGGSGIYEGGVEGIRDTKVIELGNQQVLNMVIEIEHAKKRAMEELRRTLYSKMLLRMRTFKMDVVEYKVIYFPFWVTYYKSKKEEIGFSVINAISGEFDNPWYRAFIIEGFLRKHEEGY